MNAFSRVLGLLAAASIIPPPAFAQDAQGPYHPPKLVKQGTATTPIAGKGTVTVQVLVKPDGSFQVTRVLHSTNHGDDAAALEVARSSTYRPATRDGKPIVAYYDFRLNFTGSSVSNAETPGVSSNGNAAATAGGVAQYAQMIRAGNYAGAKTGLNRYIAAHPSDGQAQAMLGVADTFLNDYAGAAGAFDKAGTIPQNYRSVAAKAYAEYALAQIDAKNGAAAVPAAKKAVALAPEFSTYNTLGTAEVASGDYADAVRDLEKARARAADAKIDGKQRAVIDANLVAAYLGAGQPDKAKSLVAEVGSLDPSNTSAQLALANYYAKQADAQMKAANPAQAAALYESAAQAAPSVAAAMYTQAAVAYLNLQPKPDYARAKADADRALAIDANSAAANYVAGVALANDGKPKDALVYLNKADAAARNGNDPALAERIQAAIKQLSGAK